MRADLGGDVALACDLLKRRDPVRLTISLSVRPPDTRIAARMVSMCAMRTPAKGVTAWVVAHQGRLRSGAVCVWSSVGKRETRRGARQPLGVLVSQSRRSGSPAALLEDCLSVRQVCRFWRTALAAGPIRMSVAEVPFRVQIELLIETQTHHHSRVD